MNKIILISTLCILFSCKKEVNIKRQNELTDLSEQIFHQKKINFAKVLKLIEENTTSKYPDSLNFTKIYADKSANVFFQVYEEPKGIINFMSYHKNDKEIYAAEYYDNGIIKCKFNTSQEGIRNDDFECYFKNGKISSKGKYLNDKRVGVEIEYDSIGNIKYEINYDDL